MRYHVLVAVALFHRTSLGLMVNSSDFWTIVQSTYAFQSLNNCTQNCISAVNGSLTNGDITCVSYGCVCGETEQSLNYNTGLSKVRECGNTNCGDGDGAALGFRKICLSYANAPAANPSTTSKNPNFVTSPKYPYIGGCGDFVINGCLDENGNRRPEKECGPVNKRRGWQDYKGIIADVKCSNPPACVCDDENFNSTVSKIIQNGQSYCGWSISSNTTKDAAYDNAQNAFANYCLYKGYPQLAYGTELVGGTPTGPIVVTVTPSAAPSSKDSKAVWSREAICALIACVLAALQVVFQVLKLIREVALRKNK